MQSKGTFEVRVTQLPPHEERDGVNLGKARVEKTFSGPLSASSAFEMIWVRTAVNGSAGYVAVERIDGALDGRRGSFVVVHKGTMRAGAQSLTIDIVPDSGTGELKGIAGSMAIEIVEGAHHYALDWQIHE